MELIKIYTESQMVLLRNLNPLLGCYRLPHELLKKTDYILQSGGIKKRGAVLILLDAVQDDIRDIEDALNLYPLKTSFLDEIIRIEIRDTGSILSKGREWYYNYVRVHKTDSRICVIYSILKEEY